MSETKAQRKAVPNTEGLEAIHCADPECGKFMAYAVIENGLISMKCHKCRTTNLRYSFNTDMPAQTAEDVVCPECGRFLYMRAVTDGKITVKCRNCGHWDEYDSSLTVAPEPLKLESKVEESIRPTLGQ